MSNKETEDRWEKRHAELMKSPMWRQMCGFAEECKQEWEEMGVIEPPDALDDGESIPLVEAYKTWRAEQ